MASDTHNIHSSQRTFAGKKNRILASEVRKHVMTGSVLMSNNPFEVVASTVLNIPTVANPIDVEDILSQKKTSSFYSIASCSSPKKITEFPRDDVEVRAISREPFTVDSTLTIPNEASVEDHVSDILTSFNDDFSIVQRRYQQYGTAEAFIKASMERPSLARSLQPSVYECDMTSQMNSTKNDRVTRSASVVIEQAPQEGQLKRYSYASTGSSGTAGSTECEQLQYSQSDPTLIEMVNRTGIAQLQTENSLRKSGRQQNFLSLLPLLRECEVIERRTPPLYPQEQPGVKLVVKPIKLDMNPTFEPIFGTLSLYDARLKRKVSENFAFDLNAGHIRDMLNGHMYDNLGRCQQAAFNISSPLTDLFLVVKLTKVLQACDIEDACEPYIAAKDDRTKDKLSLAAAEYCQRLGSYRMPLGFAIIDLQRVLCGGIVPTDKLSESVTSLTSASSAVSGATLIREEVVASSAADDSRSVLSADRASVSSSSTFKRFGSGTSASTVLNRISTPLQKRKALATSDGNALPSVYESKSWGDILESLKPTLVTLSSFYKYENDKVSDDELLKLLHDARRTNGRLSKQKTFPVNLTLQLSGTTGEELFMRLSPDLLRLAPFIPDSNADLTLEVLEFPSYDTYVVNTRYKNLMYLYIKSANFSSKTGTARNIAIKVELMDKYENPQNVVFPRDGSTSLHSHTFTTVLYHNRNPQLGDEIKLRIPLELDDGFHLLFTFFHISCKSSGKDDEPAMPIGYSWLPLYRDGHLASGDFSLPICLEKPPASYGYIPADVALPNLKWLDCHRKLFNFSISSISSVHPQDDYLEKFFIAVSSLSSNDRRRPPVGENELISAIQGILKSRPQPMVAFLYNVLDKLLVLICRSPYSEAVSTSCFETMGHLVKICTHLLDSCLDSHGRSSLLVTYIHYFKISLKQSKETSMLCSELYRCQRKPTSPDSENLFNIIQDIERSSNTKIQAEVPMAYNKTLHEELTLLWVKSSGQAREMAFIHSWFFLELLIKCMAEFLAMTGRFRLAIRKSRFNERFINSINTLSSMVTVEVFSRMSKDARQSISLSNSWAFFLRDSLSLMDRTYVFGLVKDFNQSLAMRISDCGETNSATLMSLKLDFMRIICSHEHFIVLNLPFNISSSKPTDTSSLTTSALFSQKSVIRSQLSNPGENDFPKSDLNMEFRQTHFLLGIVFTDLAAVIETPNSALHSRAVGMLHTLLCSHEADDRLSDAIARSCVASLYLPFVSIILDVVDFVHDPSGNNHESPSTLLDSHRSGIDPKVAQAISGLSNAGSQFSPFFSYDLVDDSRKLSIDMSKQLLAGVCWVLKHLDSALLLEWIQKLSLTRLERLLIALHLTVSCFEYKPETENKGKSNSDEVRWRKLTSATYLDDERLLRGSLSTEVNLCVLDILDSVVHVASTTSRDGLVNILPAVEKLILHMLSCNQSVQSLDNIFSTQRAFIAKFPDLIFEQETEQCADLCLQLLRHCTSSLPAIRAQAAASVYVLLRESFENGNLARVKMQITMALSTLVSCGSRTGCWLNEDCLRRSLKTVLVYAEMENGTVSNASFNEQVKDLVFNLHMILSDTVKMKEYVNDFEMTLDLMYRVARGYQNNPDLRLTWLLNMAARHTERGLFCEAAQCLLHGSALASEYIAMITTDDFMPSGANEFRTVSENVLEECAVSDDVVSPEVEGICESNHFTATGLIQLVERTATYLENSQLYELLPKLYRIIEPILYHWHDYRRISFIHGRICSAMANVESSLPLIECASDAWLSPARSSDKRCFGTYFRVGFYGHRFLDLDGEEFIYKEPPFTKLSEITHRLTSFYSDRLGKGVIEVIKDSNNVIRSSLCAGKAYIQITFVEPYFDKWERRRRTTHFERNYGLRRFTYSTPFTKDGKAHGPLKDQYKRRTILTTLHSFPYVKTRINVIDREQHVLQPVEVAIEDIEKKTRELSAAISQNPIDAKMLQMVLQGCIGTTVNQGPIQVANVFLSGMTLNDRGKPVDRLQSKLRLAFHDFSKKCGDALILNKSLVQSDQYAYQDELQKNYFEFRRRMDPILNSSSISNIHRAEAFV